MQEFYLSLWFIIPVAILGSCCTWCCLAHCIFLPFCVCLKRKHKLNQFSLITDGNQPFKILCAHRGGSAERMENTMAAFKHAVSLDMNMLECDVHLSRDGHVVVSHDDTLGRMCGEEFAGKRVSDFNFNDLPRYQKTVSMHLTPGEYHMRDDEEGTFPLLRDMFRECPDALISIDMKERDEILISKVNEMIIEFDREDKTVWGSMFKEQHQAAQSKN